MGFVCEICGFEAKTPASLGSHKRKHGITAKSKATLSELVSDKLETLIDKFEGVVGRFEAMANRFESGEEPALKCPECDSTMKFDCISAGQGRYQLYGVCPICKGGKLHD